MKEYAPGLDRFLETNWYSSHPAMEHLLRHSKLLEMFASMVELFAGTKSDDYDTMRKLPASEARMVWSLMDMLPRELVAPSLSAGAAAPKPMPMQIQPAAASDPELKRILNRLTVFEHLMTGAPLHENPLADLPPAHPTGYRQREFFFWKCLGQFVSLHTSAQQRFSQQLQELRQSQSAGASTRNGVSTAQPQQQNSQTPIDPQLQPTPQSEPPSSLFKHHQVIRDAAGAALDAAIPFMQMRQFLDQQENRDILYSIASVRHLSAKARLLGVEQRLKASRSAASMPDSTADVLVQVGNGGSNEPSGAGVATSPSMPETDETLLDSADTQKLRVSRRFLEDEMAGRGRDQVAQRVCAMSVRCWGYGGGG